MSDRGSWAWQMVKETRFVAHDPEELWTMVEPSDGATATELGELLTQAARTIKRAGDERTDYDGHRTTMAVLIAGTGGRGATNGSYGLAPGAKILPIRVPDFVDRNHTDSNQDDFAASTAKAIRFAADSDAKAINISMGSTAHSQELTDSVDYALSKGKLIFAAVGNTGDALNEVEYPAAIPGVAGVGAIDRNVKATKESQHRSQVDPVAPGADIVAACLKSTTKVCETRGTSDARRPRLRRRTPPHRADEPRRSGSRGQAPPPRHCGRGLELAFLGRLCVRGHGCAGKG